MSESTVQDAEVVDERPAEMTHELVPIPPPPPSLAVTPQVEAKELVERLTVIKNAAETAMEEGVDYGEIPGTNKPTLLKPGAEKLGVLFQLDIQLVNEKRWGPGDHLTVLSRATVFHAPTGARLGYGEGMCSTRERKYAYRQEERTCPACGLATIIKGKAEYGGGWLCFRKKGGCGAKYADDDQQITGQTVGQIDNPDLPDLWNTVVKMGEKRARVDAVLAVTGASAIFTQDMEDAPPPEAPAAPPAEQAQAAKPPAAEVRRPTAKPPEQTETVASPDQRRLIFARSKEQGLDQDQLKAVLEEVAGTVHTDRLPRKKVDAVLDAIKKAGAETNGSKS